MGRSLSSGIKLAAQQLSDDRQMCDLRYGTVVSVSPLKIQITNLLTLPQSVLVVPQHLTNHTVTMNVDGADKNVTIKNALKAGDKVALIRKTGGQSYYILDRV